jgi:uncharacterized membrane protein YkvA (DUF1232 family)
MKKPAQKTEKKYSDFYQNLRVKINKWTQEEKLLKKSGRWTDDFIQYLMVLPDLVHVMIKLLLDKEVSRLYKSYIVITMIYLLSPLDFIPDIIPVAGFIDDLLVSVISINKIINTNDPKILSKIRYYWAGEKDIFKQVKEIIAVMNELSSRIPKGFYNFIKKKI